MNSDMSPQTYSWWREAAEKYDYFIAGLSAALAGYLGQNLKSVDLSTATGLLEGLSVSCFVIATIAALKRVEAVVHLLRLQTSELPEKHAALTTAVAEGQSIIGARSGRPLTEAEIKAELEDHRQMHESFDALVRKVKKRAEWRSSMRDWFLIAGLVLLAIGRLWPSICDALANIQAMLSSS